MTSQETTRTMRGLCTKLCTICAWQPARVVDAEGHIRSLPRPVTVAELLRHHPHHFLCEPSPAGPLFHSAMLPLDMALEEGRVYLLLPLPRLLPHLGSGGTRFCSCFQQNAAHHGTAGLFKRWFVRKYQGHLKVSTVKVGKVVSSVVVRMSRRVLPERVRMRLSFHKLDGNFASKAEDVKPHSVQVQMCTSRNRWRPGLECISEADLLMTGLLRHDSEPLMR